MKYFKILPAILLGLTVMISSCAKEKGCMDSTATNYSADAEEDDGSCVFPTTAEKVVGTWTGTMVFTTTEGSDVSTESGAINITLSADGTGEFIESSSTDPFTWTSTDNTMTVTTDEDVMPFNITTNTTTSQVWELTQTSTEDGTTRTTVLVVTLSK